MYVITGIRIRDRKKVTLTREDEDEAYRIRTKLRDNGFARTEVKLLPPSPER